MTYLFDIGNVLLAFDFQPALQSLMGPNADPDALTKIIEKKDAFEAGQLSTEDYLKFVGPLLDYSGTDQHFYDTWNSIFTPVSATKKLAQELKDQGHRLILFSNINPIHAKNLDNYPIFKIFDAAVFSHEIQAIKPQPEFFTRAIEQFDIIPEETVYIDDMPENIAAGIAHGFQSFCYDYNNHDALLTWLNDKTS